MDRQSIDLKYISGRGIGSLAAFRRPCLYTTVYISSPSSSPRPHRQKTHTDPHGASNPEWNHPIRLYFDSNHHSSSRDLILNFDIKTQVPLLGDKLVGSVQVPLANLASEGPTETLHHVSYQVLGPDGKANGILSFSYILNESPVRVSSDPAPVQDNITLHQGSSYPTFLNDVEPQEVYPVPPPEKPDSMSQLYPPPEKPDSKPRFYPTLDTIENFKPFVYPSLLSEPNPQVYPQPPLPESKPSLYPVVSTEPAIAYPVQDSGLDGYCQTPRSLVSYPQVEPVSGLASYATPGYYPPSRAPGYCYQARGWDWDGRCL
ncbi:C2 domain-containing protein [Carex littledalei]|uniref:C2 domain-containing protein n=1 Tax=Carex littledalei TaxID=544730 RepID=A0A833QK73_9POAL|nr:C2 domain-containing protein [Carex littledalei]